jgi:prophage DNA circulation protein
MRQLEREEATKLVRAVVLDLAARATVDPGRPGSMFRLAAGDLIANAELLLENGVIAAPLAEVFDLARQAGATYDQIDGVRRDTEAVKVVGFPAFSVQNTAIRFALAQCALILAATTFKSRPEVDRYIDRVNAAFERAEIIAGDSHDQASYRSIIALHAAVTFDLATRARPLPAIVVYNFAVPQPALWLAQRLYCDAEREQDLRDENRPVHPAFMQMPLRALSQ